MIFQDRGDAGKRLAQALEKYRGENAIILGVPRGGVVVAAEVSKALDVPLDITVPRKIGAPGHEEFAIGAIAGEEYVLDTATIEYLRVPRKYIDEEIEKQRKEMERRETLYRGGRPAPEIEGKTVIIIDDGIATGATTLAAVRSMKKMNPEKIVLAVPVAPPETKDLLAPEVDDIIVLETPAYFNAVGAWYRYFDQTSDAEVISLLNPEKRTEPLKIVIDTNLFIATNWNKRSASSQILEAAQRGEVKLFYTKQMVRELNLILGNIRASEEYRWQIANILHRGEELDVPRTLRVVKDDPDDDKFLECAQAAGADFLVTSDSHLLQIGEFEGTRIVKPSHFLKILESD